MWKTGYCIDTKQAQEESPTNQQPMKRLDSISFASVVMISSSCLFPSAAETPWRGVNEQKWAELIQSDISNQASAETICTNSTNFATTSKDATFKVWANSIAQTYCNEDNDENDVVEGVEKAKAAAPIANKEEQCRLDSSEIYKISLGEKVHKYDKGCWSSFN
tara:strand:+ start:397 stop:885 length:489 start_codon:yes stop_codon:yes gene_type:complete